jgi:hypothetical protein
LPDHLHHRPAAADAPEPDYHLVSYENGNKHVVLLRLSKASVESLINLFEAGREQPPDAGLAEAASVHRITETDLMPMKPGPQNDMLRACIMAEHPLIIGSRGRSFWQAPMTARCAVQHTRAGMRFVYECADATQGCSRELDEADARWLALMTARAADVPRRLRELATVSPDLAFHALYRPAAPSHLPDRIRVKPIICDLAIADLGHIVAAAAAGPKRAKVSAAAARGWSVWRRDRSEGARCPACASGTLAYYRARRGRAFLSCSRRPECDHVIWIDPDNGP